MAFKNKFSMVTKFSSYRSWFFICASSLQTPWFRDFLFLPDNRSSYRLEEEHKARQTHHQAGRILQLRES